MKSLFPGDGLGGSPSPLLVFGLYPPGGRVFRAAWATRTNFLTRGFYPMFKINTAVPGFGIGNFINATTGAVTTTGVPVCKRTIDGVAGACTNAAAYSADSLGWVIDLTAEDLNGSSILFVFFLEGCIPIDIQVKTVLGVPQATIAATGDLSAVALESTAQDILAGTAAILADTGTDGVVVAAESKAGYALASTGLDSISITAPTGVASNFREMLVQVWRSIFMKSTKTPTQIKTYADDGTTVVTTQAISDDGAGNQVKGTAS